MKKFFLPTLLLSMIALAVGFFVLQAIQEQDVFDGDGPNSGFHNDSQGAATEVKDLLMSGGNVDDEVTPISMIDPAVQPSLVKDVFDFSLPLVEGFEEMAIRGDWSYDGKLKNIGLWGFLCQTNDHEISLLLKDSSDADSVRENVTRLCEGFDTKKQEIDEFLEVEVDERMLGNNDRATLENSLDKFGPNVATIAAVAELSRSLDSLDYAGVVGAVWFLGVYHFDGVSQELVLYSRQPNVETIYSVSSSIFCNYIGGCDRNHPITLNLCLMFPWLPCSRRPDNIYEAIDQILTGNELETFNEMNAALIRLLNRHRQGTL